MGFWSAIFGGSNPDVDKAKKKAGQVADYATGTGERLTTQTGNLISSLISGDPSKATQLLAPQISGVQQRAQQGKNTLAQFGTRSGGTAAQAAGIDASTRGDVNNMISSLTGNAVGMGASMGQGLLDVGMNALSKQVDFSQIQLQNWNDSIFGRGLTTAAAYGESAGLNSIHA